MRKNLTILRNSALFQGLEDSEIAGVRGCLAPMIRQYKKDEFIFSKGDPINSVGLLIEGTAIVIKEDFYGRRLILEKVLPGQVFAEVFACLSKAPAEMSAVAQEDCQVMTFDLTGLIDVCPSACPYHIRVVRNLLVILADKNMQLTQKVDFLSRRTIRERLLAYLSSELMRQGKTSFIIPYNRQQLADYLSVDRSALSTEINKLQREGILTTNRNQFSIHVSKLENFDLN